MATDSTQHWNSFVEGLRQLPRTDLHRLGRLNDAYSTLETPPATEAEADKRIALLKEYEDERRNSEIQARYVCLAA
jgi:hypothetical protein